MTLAELNRYDENKKSEEQKWVSISKILVPTLEDKQQLLAAFKYLHDLNEIDTDILAVNTIAHLYHNPDLIEVQANNEDSN